MLHSVMLFGVSVARDVPGPGGSLRGLVDVLNVLMGAGLLVCLAALVIAAAMKALATTVDGEPNPAVNEMLTSSMVGAVLIALAYMIVGWLT